MESVKVVLHYVDGSILRGYTRDFHPRKTSFSLQEVDAGLSEKPIELGIEGLKALFFVKTFEGQPDYSERKMFLEADRAEGHRVEVTFSDGELLQGFTISADLNRPGFFLFLPDLESNNLAIFVISNAVRTLRYL